MNVFPHSGQTNSPDFASGAERLRGLIEMSFHCGGAFNYFLFQDTDTEFEMRAAAKEAASLAILASVGEIDPQGTRKDGLDVYLDEMVREGYVIETRSDTHAIIFRRPRGLKRFTSGRDPGRYVVQVNEDGVATMRPAEPRRT